MYNFVVLAQEVDMRTLFPNLVEMERDLPAFVAHRVKQLKTPNRLIEEVDSQPEPPPRLPPGQLKPVVFRSLSPALAQVRGRERGRGIQRQAEIVCEECLCGSCIPCGICSSF